MIRSIGLFCALALLFGGCVNRRGVSATYYNDCRPYYDVQGTYHEACDPNLIEYKDVKKAVEDALREPGTTQDKKVW